MLKTTLLGNIAFSYSDTRIQVQDIFQFTDSMLPCNAILCRYNEIGTKGRNRSLFEEQLSRGIVRAFLPIGQVRIQHEIGRLFVFPPRQRPSFTEEELIQVRKQARTIAGLSSLSPGYYLPPDFSQIRTCVLETFPERCRAFLAAHPELSHPGYAMRARRADKQFPMTCDEIERTFANLLLPEFPQMRVDLKNPDFRVDLEIRPKQAFLSYETVAGPGGLPTGSGGKILCLLSGGFDSPVACYETIRRGCTADFLTFHSDPYTPPAYLTKVAAIARKLNEYQKRGRLIAVNLLPAQKEIRDRCRSRFRTILYRRIMLRIANMIALRLGCQALATGDNIGQVASQTLENMSVINQVSSMLVLRPLVTFDKLQIMAIAREIGTFDLSIENVPDSCTVFAPDDPCTTSTPHQLEEEEALLDLDHLIQQCLEQSVFLNPVTMQTHPLLENEESPSP